MTDMLELVRPADLCPKKFRLDFNGVYIREVTSVQRKFGSHPSLWIFGNRRFIDDQKTAAYRSIAIKVINFAHFVYMDGTGLEPQEINSIIDSLNKDLQSDSCDSPILGYTIVAMKHLIGFDYEQWLKTGSLNRPMIKLTLAQPMFARKLEARLKLGPVMDYRKKEHSLTAYHTDYDYNDLFVHVSGIKLQGWAEFSHLEPVRSKETFFSDEFTFDWRHHKVSMFENCTIPAVNLCASIRIRIAIKEVADQKTATFSASTANFKQDKIIAVACDVYWSGHQTEVAKIRLNCKNPFLANQSGMLDGEQELITKLQAYMNLLNVDTFIVMNDNQDDLLHLALRGFNLSRFKDWNCRPQEKKLFPGEYYYQHPSRTVINMVEYLKKMQVKPKFDAYTLLAALNHPAMYNSVDRSIVNTFLPNAAALKSSEEALAEIAIESEVLRICEQTPNVLADSLALSSLCSCDVTSIVSRGQQLRCWRRLQSDAHKSGRIINKEHLRLPPVVVNSKEYNSFPEPPKLYNCPINKRDATYDEKWSRSVLDNPLPPNIRLLKIKEPPLVESSAVSFEEQVVEKKQKPIGLFGQEQIEKPKKLSKAKPKKKKYPGGYVQDPKADVYTNLNEMIGTLDFSSLYPSIMISEAICYCVLAWDSRIVYNPRLTKKYIEIIPGESIVIVTHIDGKAVEAMLAETEKALVAERKRIQKMESESEEKCEHLLKDLGLPANTKQIELDALILTKPEWKQQLTLIRDTIMISVNLNKQQLGCKLVQNALYGFLGAQKNPLLACIVLMAAVTAVGRWQIKTSAWYCIRYEKAAIIYGDTDSIMVQLPVTCTTDKLEDWNEVYFAAFRKLVVEISDLFPKPQKLNMEDLSVRSLFFTQKKNYVKKIYEKPDVFKKLKISGVGFMKRDRCKWACLVCTKVTKMLIDGETTSIPEYLRSEFKKLSSGSVLLPHLATSISLKEKSAYKGSSDLIQLRLADKIHSRTGVYPPAGSRLTFIIVENKDAKKNCDKGELLDWAMKNKVIVDLHHYIRQIRPLLELLCCHHPLLPLEQLLKECESDIQRAKALRTGSVLSFFKVKPKSVESIASDEVDELKDVEFAEDSDDEQDE